MMDRELGEQIVRRLDVIVGLLVNAVTADKTQTEKIWALSAAGFQPKEIAQIVGTTANAVRVTLHGLRKKSKGSTKRSLGRDGDDQ